MKPVVIKFGFLAFLIFLITLNFYKTFNNYTHPDFPYDARNVYLAGQLIKKGANPYNDSLLKNEWSAICQQNLIKTLKPPGFPHCGMIYPFWALPILQPYYAMKWANAKIFIWFISVFFFLVIVFFAYKIFEPLSFSLGLCLLILLAFKSSLVALSLGQPLLMSMAALMACLYYYDKNKAPLAGLLLGIALVKFTICIPFVLFFLIHKKWKLLAFSAIFPLLGALSFYLYTGHFFIYEMLNNMALQMQINYAGPVITGVNTNLTELGILFNYFFSIPYQTISSVSLLMLVLGIIFISFFYIKKRFDTNYFMVFVILWNLMFSYHLLYDAILLIFMVPIVLKSKAHKFIWVILLAPLFLPINGIFKQTDWIQFHLPLSLFVIFLYLIYDCRQSYLSRNF